MSEPGVWVSTTSTPRLMSITLGEKNLLCGKNGFHSSRFQVLVIEATEGQSNGVTRAHVKASGIKLVDEPTAEAIDIRADYVAKYGAPSAAAPKIFFRYYYVNSSTGEKSGTMLAEVKWAAAAAGGEP